MKKLPKRIIIDFIPHNRQRYNTAGDYYIKKGILYFKISKMKPDYMLLLMVHELVEQYLTARKGITNRQIDQWDMKHDDTIDPGLLKDCPYYSEHLFCLGLEKLICQKIGINWKTYDNSFDKLVYNPKRGKK